MKSTKATSKLSSHWKSTVQVYSEWGLSQLDFILKYFACLTYCYNNEAKLWKTWQGLEASRAVSDTFSPICTAASDPCGHLCSSSRGHIPRGPLMLLGISNEECLNSKRTPGHGGRHLLTGRHPGTQLYPARTLSSWHKPAVQAGCSSAKQTRSQEVQGEELEI
jgi:hypothetical protein